MGSAYTASLPVWVSTVRLLILASPTISWVALFVVWHTQRKRIIVHYCKLCPKCQYALSGLAFSGACPECGTMYSLPAAQRAWHAWLLDHITLRQNRKRKRRRTRLK